MHLCIYVCAILCPVMAIVRKKCMAGNMLYKANTNCPGYTLTFKANLTYVAPLIAETHVFKQTAEECTRFKRLPPVCYIYSHKMGRPLCAGYKNYTDREGERESGNPNQVARIYFTFAIVLRTVNKSSVKSLGLQFTISVQL